MGGALCMAAGIIMGTFLAMRIGRTRVMVFAAGTAALLGASMIPASALVLSPSILLALPCVALFMNGLGYGPLGSWLPELFPPDVRYTGASLGFNMAGVLGGAATPFIAQALLRHGGMRALALYVCLAAILAFAATIVGSMRLMHRAG
jgi:MFS family permease